MLRRVAFITLLAASSAWADKNDYDIASFGNPQSDASANARFRIFARQLAAALTSVNLSPPDTLGHSGFAISLEGSWVSLGTGRLPVVGGSTNQSQILIPSVHLRKGLPFSFELGARVAYLVDSRMGAATMELKWAVVEGFKFAPDLAIRGNVTKLIGSRDFDLTSGGVDFGIGKQLPAWGMVSFTPYAGLNLTFVGASSNTVDYRPTRTLADSDAEGEQFTDFYTYGAVNAPDNLNSRVYGGLRFIAGVVQLGVEVAYTMPSRFNDSRSQGEVPGTLAVNTMLGLDF